MSQIKYFRVKDPTPSQRVRQVLLVIVAFILIGVLWYTSFKLLMDEEVPEITGEWHEATYRTDPQWSPDGQKIAYISDEYGEDLHLIVMNADGSSKKALKDLGMNIILFSWHPEGKDILLSILTPEPESSTVWLINVENAKATMVIRGVAHGISPTGRYVLIRRETSYGETELEILDLEYEGNSRSVEYRASGGTWCENADEYIFTYLLDGNLSIFDMGIVDVLRWKEIGPASDTGTWSPDCTRILASHYVEGPYDYDLILYTNLQDEVPTATRINRIDQNTRVQWINEDEIMVTRNFDSGIYVFNLETRAERFVAEGFRAHYNKGKVVFVLRDGIYSINIDGTELKKLT